MTGLPPYLKVWIRHCGVCYYSLQTLIFLRAFITPPYSRQGSSFISLTELSIGHHRIRYFSTTCWGHACRPRKKPVPGSQMVGKMRKTGQDAKLKGTRKGVFSCSRFLNPRGPDYLGACNRLTAPRRSRTISCTVALHSEIFTPPRPRKPYSVRRHIPVWDKKESPPSAGEGLNLDITE